MSPGAKVFLTLAGLGTVFGVLAIASSKKANASTLPPKADGGGSTVVVPPHDGQSPVVVPAEPEAGIERGSPFSVPGVQDGAEAARLLLRWLAAEGQSLIASDTAPDRPTVPADFGSKSSDLDGSFGQRVQQVAAAFEHYNGLSPENGILTNTLLLALRRWAQGVALPPEPLPPRVTPSSPTLPPVLLPVPSSGPPPLVPLPPIVPQNPPIVPVPPFIPGSTPTQEGPPPFVPPSSPASTPVPVLTSLPPSVPVSAQPATAQTPPPGATTVPKDTAAMVNALLLAEQSNGWNKAEPSVQAYQKPRGLKQDGLFGPKTALDVAESFGTIPIIRVWPAGSQKAKALQDYRAALIEIANHTTDATRAAQLRVSAQREQGQGFGVVRGKAKALPSDLQVSIARV